jgi:hypothetical protein
MLWRELLTSLNLGALNKMVFGTDYRGVCQRPYMDKLMSINRYATHEDLRIPESQLVSIIDENVTPLLPRTSEFIEGL